jgi:2-polyprenyl-3-methyl-5-hydroxy-6-metoxy-1,4-benzoquinol methylase
MANETSTSPDRSDTYREQSRYYDKYWTEHALQLNQAELLRLAQIIAAFAHIPRAGSISICDLGCGTGWLSAELAKFGKTTGIDLSPEGIVLARKRWPGIEFQAANILKWRPESRFDVMVSSEVLEHVEDKRAFAATIEAAVKPGGHLILTTPNRKLQSVWDRADAGSQFLELWVSPKELRQLFQPTFEVIYHQTFMFDYLYTGLYRWTSAPKLLSLLGRVGAMPIYDGFRTALHLGLYQIYVARRRVPG